MVRELPKIDFNGTPFFIDIRLGEFRQVDNPHNRIDFDELYETPNGYKIHLDPLTKSAFRGTEGEFVGRDDLALVKLPPLEQMDPVGFRQMADQWKTDNPMLAAAIEKLPVIMEQGEVQTIGQVLKSGVKKQAVPLMEKKRVSPKKGLRP